MSANDQSRIGPSKIGPLGLRMDLIALREAKGWNTRQLAARADIVHETVRRIENGQIPGFRVQFAYAEVLGIDPKIVVPQGARQWARR